MTDQHILLARQPIFDIDIKVSAYELLFRGDNSKQANVFDGELQEIINSMPLSQLVADTLLHESGPIGTKEMELAYRESIRRASQLAAVFNNA